MFHNIFANVTHIPHHEEGSATVPLFCRQVDKRFVREGVVMSNGRQEHLNANTEVLCWGDYTVDGMSNIGKKKEFLSVQCSDFKYHKTKSQFNLTSIERWKYIFLLYCPIITEEKHWKRLLTINFPALCIIALFLFS